MVWIMIVVLLVIGLVIAVLWGNSKRRQRVMREIGLTPLEERVVERFLEVAKFPDPITEERHVRAFGRHLRQADRAEVELCARGDMNAMHRMISASDEAENARIADKRAAFQRRVNENS
ncbi:MAG: hypothetical protein AAFR76_04020 [Planctomycetota bacterium]